MTKSKDAGLSPALVETVAGLSAGTMATLIVHPLDIVKTRMQSKQTRPTKKRKGQINLRITTANQLPVQKSTAPAPTPALPSPPSR